MDKDCKTLHKLHNVCHGIIVESSFRYCLSSGGLHTLRAIERRFESIN